MKQLCALVVVALVCSASLGSTPYLWVDFPQSGFIGGRTMQVYGTALNSDVVHIWAFPGGVGHFVGAAYTSEANPQRQLDQGSFSLIAHNMPIGTYPVAFYARDPATGAFPTQMVMTVTVRDCNWSMVNWAFYGPSGQTSVTLPYCS